MIITVQATPATTLVIYPHSDQVVWILGGAEKKTVVTNMAQAEVMLLAESYRRQRLEVNLMPKKKKGRKGGY